MKLKEIIGASVKETVESVGNAFDKNFTSHEERLIQKNSALQKINELGNTLINASTKIIIAEASGNWLQRSWRPLIMLMFGVIIFYNMFLALLFSLPVTDIKPEMWELMKLGLGGFVIGRTAEKIAKEVAPGLNFGKNKRG